MGLDAHVRCRCFEEGKLKPAPVPLEDIYVDEEGYLWTKEPNEAFYEWLQQPCEHEDGDYLWVRVGNFSGRVNFAYLVEEAGGEAEFPLLSHLLPGGNGGQYPASKAKATLEELDRFTALLPKIAPDVLLDGRYWTAEQLRKILTASLETGNPVLWC